LTNVSYLYSRKGGEGKKKNRKRVSAFQDITPCGEGRGEEKCDRQSLLLYQLQLKGEDGQLYGTRVGKGRRRGGKGMPNYSQQNPFPLLKREKERKAKKAARHGGGRKKGT